MAESGFAVDANLLLHPTPRRLLHGLALETGNSLLILPEVHKEGNRGLLFEPSETMRELARDNAKTAYLWFMSHTLNGVRDSEAENHLTFRNALQAIKRSGFVGQTASGFRTIVWQIERYYERDQRFQENLEEALSSAHHKVSLESELRRIGAIRLAHERLGI